MYNQNTVVGNIATLSFTVPEAGPGFISLHNTVQKLSQGSSVQSALVVTVKQNGTTIYTSNPSDDGLRLNYLGAVSDVLTIAFSSASAADTNPPQFKSVISMGSGC